MTPHGDAALVSQDVSSPPEARKVSPMETRSWTLRESLRSGRSLEKMIPSATLLVIALHAKVVFRRTKIGPEGRHETFQMIAHVSTGVTVTVVATG